MADPVPTPESKPWYLSKTMWLNLVMGLAAALGGIVPALAPVKDWLAANVVLVNTVWAGLGLLLRLISNGKVVLWD